MNNISNTEFTTRRQSLTNYINDGIFILPGNTSFVRNHDVNFDFRQTYEYQFDLFCEELILYKEKNGDCNYNNRYVSDSGYKLGNNSSNLRDRRKKGKLSKEQIERLNEIGFMWDRKKYISSTFRKSHKSA